MATADIQVAHITADEYAHERTRLLEEERERVSRAFVQQIEALLQQVQPYCDDEELAKQTAKDIVFHGKIPKSIHCNACAEDKDSDDEKEEEEIRRVIDEVTDVRNVLAEILQFSVSLLLIKAPVEEEGRSLEDDEKARTCQYENAMKNHPHLRQENSQIHKEDRTVSSYDEMKIAIEDFIEVYGKRSILVSVYFNGHGTKEGMLRFHEGKKVPVNDVIADVQKTMQERRSDLGLPNNGELVLCNCYAHKHDSSDSDDFKIYTFTSEERKKTYVVDSGEDVTDSHHVQMNKFTKGEHPEWSKADQKLAAIIGNNEPSTSVGGTEAEGDVIPPPLKEGNKDGGKGNKEGTDGQTDDTVGVQDINDRFEKLGL